MGFTLCCDKAAKPADRKHQVIHTSHNLKQALQPERTLMKCKEGMLSMLEQAPFF